MEKFSWATIIVRNMEESLKFYQEIVGLSLNRSFTTSEGAEFAFLGAGGTEVELIHDPSRDDLYSGQGIALGFHVDSLDEMMEYVKGKGLPIHSGPFQPNPSTRFFYVLDPDGLKIQFVEVSE